MSSYKVELIAIDESNNSKNQSIEFIVEATTENDAIRKAKSLASNDHNFNVRGIWAWNTEKKRALYRLLLTSSGA